MELQIEVLRLLPGQDLRDTLAAFLASRQQHKASPTPPVRAACVLSAVGSLSQAVLRYAEAPDGSVLDGPLELLSLSGTLGLDGVHLHTSVADAAGRVFGGHLMPGNTVRTTAEIVLALLPGWIFGREVDASTGYRELRAQRF